MGKHNLKSCGVHSTIFLRQVCPFFNIMHKRVIPSNDPSILPLMIQPAFTFSKLTKETLEQGVKYVQS